MSDHIKLSPCPRCGGKEATLRDHYCSTMWDVICDMCCWTDMFDEEERAIFAWNEGIVNISLDDYKRLLKDGLL